MKLPTSGEVLFSVKSFIAAMLALYLAMRIGLPRPFWAPLAAYVVSQPMAGAVRSKTLYRISGTILGASVTVMLVPRLINYSVLLTLALSLWLGLCVYLSLLDRTPRAYVFILAGYTPAIIGFPALVDTSAFSYATMFDTALARVEEITLGVVCASLVHSVIFPQSIGPVILGRMDRALENAMVWIRHAFLIGDVTQSTNDHRRLAQDITELRILSTHLPFDTSNLRWTANAIRVLQDRLASLVPFMTAVEDRIRLMRGADGRGMSPRWRELLIDIAEWTLMDKNCTPESGIQLQRRIAAMTPVADSRSTWNEVIEVNLAAHLSRLIDACENCFHQRRQIELGMEGKIPVDPRQLSHIPTRALHTDRRLALMSAFAAFMALCGSCAFWIISGWPLGFAAPMMAGMQCAFFATLDDPVPILKTSLIFTLISTPFAGLYLLFLLPSAHSFEMLMLVMAPFMLIGGIYVGRPSTVARAIPLWFTTLATLTMFDMGSSDMTAFINSQISQGIGVGLAVLFTSLFRNVNSRLVALRLLRAGWDEIARIAQSVRTPPVTAVTVRMVDRVSLLTPRLATVGGQSEQTARHVLEDMRTGLNLAHLLRVRSRLERNSVDVQSLLQDLTDHFRNKSLQTPGRDPKLLEKIDQTLRGICSTPPFPMRNEALAAVAGIRRDLFPEAVPYQPELQSQ